jgi:signal transduction histidine kinase
VVATRAAQLTRQLLIFSRREVAGATVIDLNTVVTDMGKLLGRTLGEAIELVTDLATDLPRTKIDRGQVEQVLMNLVVNARDAMPTGGRHGSRQRAARPMAIGPSGRAIIPTPARA